MFLNLQNCPKLQPSRFRSSINNKTSIPVKGCCILHITHGITAISILFHIIHNGSPPILESQLKVRFDQMYNEN